VKRVRFDHLMASSALGLALVVMGSPSYAQVSEQKIEAAVPMPDTTPLPPPTAKDVGVAAAKSAPMTTGSVGEPKVEASVPMPDTTPLPPLTAQDVGVAVGKTVATRSMSEKKIEAAAPMPNTATVPPPAAKDVASTVPAAAKPKINNGELQASIPMPDTTTLPPLTVRDMGSAFQTAVADQLRTLISHKLDRFVDRKTDRAGVEAFYRAHDYAPVWTTDGVANERGKAVIAFLAQVDTDGLNPGDYPAPNFAKAKDAVALANAELELTNSVLTYARHAQIGQINYTRVGADIKFNLDAPDPADVLAKLAKAKDVDAALDSYNPPQEGFKLLKAKLAELRNGGKVDNKPAAEKKLPHVRIPDGKILSLGMRDQRVPLLRKRLDIAGDKASMLYDQAVADAVKTFQTEADIGVDGDVGPNTTRALNGEKQEAAHRPSANAIDTILVNMDRWRWLPRKLGNSDGDYVVVNVPDYTLTLMHDNKLYWKTKIVVGKPGKATPMITAEMKFITVNPTWNVPPSIIENEYLPALQEDPTALDRIGLKLRQDPDGTVHIYQPPGAGNALGRIRFNFPNKFLVYQHDTPDKYLFARSKRAYSHGCMRVQNPVEYATKLLSLELPKQHYTPQRIEGMYGESEINIDFPRPIPVHLTYQTAFVDQDGKLQIREDVYGRDAKMISILKNKNERRVADIAIEHRPDPSSRPVRMPVGMYGSGDTYGSSYNNSGPGFFDWLFGGQQPAQQNSRQRSNVNGPHANGSGRYTRR
jgi:L,D-transpeptidase YcbB